MVSSLKNLKAFAKKHGHEIEPELFISIENGTVELVGLPTDPSIMLDVVKLVIMFPEKEPAKTSITRGRPKTGHLAIDPIMEKIAAGMFTGTATKEAKTLEIELAEKYAGSGINPPKEQAIIKIIREIRREMLVPE
jgi:hypothetical protein